MNKFIAMNRFKIAIGRESDFEDIWKNRETHLDDVNGFQKFNLLKGSTNEEYTLYTSHSIWDSKPDFENWKKSEAFRRAHSGGGHHKGFFVCGIICRIGITMKKSYLLLLFFTSTLQAQIDTLWTRTFGGSGHDLNTSVQVTDDGGYIIAGYTHSFGNGIADGWLIKTDSEGNEEWNQTYGGEYWDEIYSVQQTTDGGYIFTGLTGNWPDYDLWLVKTDSNGDSLWTKTFGGSEIDYGEMVQLTNDGGFIITGTNSGSLWLIKTDSEGNEEWNQAYSGGHGFSIQKTTDSGYIITGLYQGTDVLLMKTDSEGNELWNQTFGGEGFDRGNSVQQTIDGGYIIASITESFGSGSFDSWLIKTDSNGDSLWTKTFGGSEIDYGEMVQLTNDGGYIITGSTESFGSGSYDVWLVKTDSEGNEEWHQTFGGGNDDRSRSIQQTLDGGYIITGNTMSYGNGGVDIWLLKGGPFPGLTWHVSTTGSDENDGSETNPFATIQAGIDAASDGDTVLVAAGTYVENINYNGNSIAVIGENRETTIIDGNQNGSVVTFESGEDSTTLLMNFTITNSGGFGESDWGGGVFVNGGSKPILDNLIIHGNIGGGLYGSAGGGGLGVIGNGSKVNISNSIISNTTSESESGGLFTCNNGRITASNCLIVNNFYYGVSNGCNSGAPGAIELINCTVTNNHEGLYCMGEVSVSSSVIYDNLNWDGLNYDIIGGTLTMTNTLIQGGYEGEGNIDTAPLFCDAENGDYSLAENSPCVGTGENGANMGAFGVGCEALILAPVLTDISDQQIEEDGSVTLEISATSNLGLDMTFSVYSDTSDVIVSLDNTTLTATPEPDWYGTTNITVMVTDENDLSDTTDFTLTVTPVNDSPEEFSVIYPTVTDTFSTHVDSDTAIVFNWEESSDVDSDVTYTLTIELEFFGNTYTDVHENISDTTISISSNSLDPLLNVTSQDIATFTYYVNSSDGEYMVASDVGEFVLFRAALGVNGGLSVPVVYALHQNYPNPFNPVTTLQYDLPEDAMVSITIYDMMGRVVSNLVSSQQNAGYKSIQWNATNNIGQPVSAGLYLYTIQAGDYIQTKKMVLLK